MIKRVLLSLILLFSLFKVNSFTQNSICALPDEDRAQTLSTSANTFYTSQTGNIIPGSNLLILEALRDPFSVKSRVYSLGATQKIPCNLLLIIQPQEADINSGNTAAYGTGKTVNSVSGYIGTTTAGCYECVVALNNVKTAGGKLQLQGARTTGGRVNRYNPSTSAYLNPFAKINNIKI